MTYYGKDCPEGMVQVEFVGCSPSDRYGEYGWKPVKFAFIEIYVDGRRFRIDVGNFTDTKGQRRGLHIISDRELMLDKTAMNSCSVYFEEDFKEEDENDNSIR